MVGDQRFVTITKFNLPTARLILKAAVIINVFVMFHLLVISQIFSCHLSAYTAAVYLII